MLTSTLGGLLFLVGGISVFVVGILLIAHRERSTKTPNKSVHSFERSRYALGKIHRTQVSLKDAARARARAMHPSSRGRHRKRSA